jgi:hypothetical protein
MAKVNQEMFISFIRSISSTFILNTVPTSVETKTATNKDKAKILKDRQKTLKFVITQPRDMASIGDKSGATIIPAITSARLSAINPSDVIMDDKETIK